MIFYRNMAIRPKPLWSGYGLCAKGSIRCGGSSSRNPTWILHRSPKRQSCPLSRLNACQLGVPIADGPKTSFSPFCYRSARVLIGDGADQDDCLLVEGGRRRRCWSLVPGQHSDLPNVALMAWLQIWVFGYSAFFRGSSAGLTKVISNGPIKLNWKIIPSMVVNTR